MGTWILAVWLLFGNPIPAKTECSIDGLTGPPGNIIGLSVFDTGTDFVGEAYIILRASVEEEEDVFYR